MSRNTAVMAAGTLLSRLTGFGRLVALAYALGFSRLTDTYNLANVTPNIVYELVLGGVLSATLVPVFVDRLSRDDEDDAWRAISAVVTAAAAVLLLLTVAFFLLAPVLIRLYTLGNQTGSADDQQAVATTLLRMFAPQVAFYGMVTVTTAVLHARRRFAAPMFAPVLNNVLVIGVLLALPEVTDRLSLTAMRGQPGAVALLGLGTTAGVAAMALALLPALRRARVGLRLVWDPRHEAVRAVLRLSGWTFGFVAANQVALWVVLVLANGRPGDVSAYQAGQIFFLLPHGVFAVSVMSALLPDLSERWSRRDVDAYRHGIGLGLRTIAAVLVPAAVGYICLARPIVTVALEHGALQASSAATTADVLALLAIGLPGFSAYLFLTRAYQAMQDTRSMFFLYLVENAINVVVALALYPVMGVAGLALAYAVAYTAGTVVALAHLGRRIGGVGAAAVVRSWLRVLVASGAMASAVVAVASLVEPDLVEVATAVVAGAVVYLLAARALGVEEVSTLLRIRRRVA
ncbi:MAG TPA: murein biosynthesis integral membrane protein MurJ [Acidimicrobiales bacterium]|nr:murein biosynthesis integral membrane protein MurJ [Acidimicrobiales bacterium]